MISNEATVWIKNNSHNFKLLNIKRLFSTTVFHWRPWRKSCAKNPLTVRWAGINNVLKISMNKIYKRRVTVPPNNFAAYWYSCSPNWHYINLYIHIVIAICMYIACENLLQLSFIMLYLGATIVIMRSV